MRSRPSDLGVLSVAMAVIVTALVAIGTRGSSEPGTAAPLADETTSPEPTPTHSPPPARPGAPAGTDQGVRSTPPAAIRPSGAPTPAAPSSTASATALGTYEYSETNPEGTSDSTLEVTSQGGARRVENHDSGRAVSEVEWRRDGKYVRVSTFRTPGGDVRCDWNPDFVQFKYPLRRGASWAVQSSCRPNATTTLSVKGSGRVTEARERTVGGRRVSVWVVTSDVTFTFTGGGASQTLVLHDVEDFAPSHGLTVYDVLTTTATDPSGERSERKTTRVLKSLSPTRSA